MEIILGKNRKARFAYGFDDVSIVPGGYTIDPADVDISMEIGNLHFQIPFVASAMDSVVGVKFARAMHKEGGLAVMNLHGLQTRYANPDKILIEASKKKPDELIAYLQKVYEKPIEEKLIVKRIEEMKAGGAIAAVSSIPIDAEAFGKIAQDAGADLFLVQSTVTALEHKSKSGSSLSLKSLCKKLKIPVIVGNCVSYEVALELMKAGASGVLVGIGPGAACTTRGVVGVGVPQITATADVAAAREDYYKKTKRRVAVITDGGMRVGADICKALAAGADGVMIGSPFAATQEAAGRGYHWGMAASHKSLPRGTRVQVKTIGTLNTLLNGPSSVDDGTMNFVGSIRSALGLCGANNIRQFHSAELVASNSFQTEGKMLQSLQRVGMGR